MADQPMRTFYINPGFISLKEVSRLLKSSSTHLKLSEQAREKVDACRKYLDKKLERSSDPIYGINTGFGALHSTIIEGHQLETLQENLVMSHACGTGKKASLEVVRAMLFLKINGLSFGYSAAQVETIEALIDLYNHELYPVVFEQGSLGASGDLAPLAHLALPLLGKGEVWYKGRTMPAMEGLALTGIQPIKLKSKEGLALLNGTQFMGAMGLLNVLKAERLIILADLIGALSLDAFDGRIEPFYELVHLVRRQEGQLESANLVRRITKGSELINRKKKHIQDPYSFRCIPQVHGATRQAFSYIYEVVENELNAVTDNPTVFAQEDMIISAGNFHGQPLALAMDHLALIISELGSISERRIYKLLGGYRDLPPFLVKNPGLNSGFMIPQYTAASIASLNRQLCTPSSADNVTSSNGQEDHVSLGANAAVKTAQVLDNVERILAIEWLNAAQALEFRRPLKTSPYLEKLVNDYRKKVPFVEEDRVLYPLIEESILFIQNMDLDEFSIQ
jgi:histidine ammonia-lyase